MCDWRSRTRATTLHSPNDKMVPQTPSKIQHLAGAANNRHTNRAPFALLSNVGQGDILRLLLLMQCGSRPWGGGYGGGRSFWGLLALEQLWESGAFSVWAQGSAPDDYFVDSPLPSIRHTLHVHWHSTSQLLHHANAPTTTRLFNATLARSQRQNCRIWHLPQLW